MLSAKDCLAKADEIDRQTAQCDAPTLREELISTANTWRQLAIRALWQDRVEASDPPA